MTGDLIVRTGLMACVVGCGVLAIATAVGAQREDALTAAARALGADALRSLQFTGSGATFTVGQNFTPNHPWPRVTLKAFAASIDFDRVSMQLDLVREMGTTMPRGGGVPFTGELRQTQVIVGDVAWDIAHGTDPSAGALPTCPCTPPVPPTDTDDGAHRT